MTDITMCQPTNCDKKTTCYRYTATPSERQAYCDFSRVDENLPYAKTVLDTAREETKYCPFFVSPLQHQIKQSWLLYGKAIVQRKLVDGELVDTIVPPEDFYKYEEE